MAKLKIPHFRPTAFQRRYIASLALWCQIPLYANFICYPKRQRSVCPTSVILPFSDNPLVVFIDDELVVDEDEKLLDVFVIVVDIWKEDLSSLTSFFTSFNDSSETGQTIDSGTVSEMVLIGSFLKGFGEIEGAAWVGAAATGAATTASTPLTGVLDLGDALGVILGEGAGGTAAAAIEKILSGSPTESTDRRESVDPL